MAEHGIRSLLSFRMAPDQASPGALNLYSTRARAFGDDAQVIGAAFAQQAAVAVYGVETISALERALHTRDEIGQAKGILIQRFGLTGGQAFDLLVESSQHTNTRLAEVAHWLVTEATTGGQDRGGQGRGAPDTPTPPLPGPPPRRRPHPGTAV